MNRSEFDIQSALFVFVFHFLVPIVHPVQADPAVEAHVDELVKAASTGRISSRRLQDLKKHGSRAVSPLLDWLERGNKIEKAMALSGLNYVWSKEARKPVASHLDHSSDAVRKMARTALLRHAPDGVVAHLARPYLEHGNPEVSGEAFQLVEQHAPNASRMHRFLEDQAYWDKIHEYLPRYYDSDLTPATREMLRNGEPEAKRSAIVSLIYQNATDRKTRELVRQALTSRKRRMVALAAEYFAWHGRKEDVALLERVEKQFDSSWAGSSIRTARATVRRRVQKGRAGISFDPVDSISNPGDYSSIAKRYARARRRIESHPRDREAWRDGWAILSGLEEHEPVWKYEGKNPSGAFDQRSKDRTELIRTLLVLPGSIEPGEDSSGERTDGQTGEVPPSDDFIPPVRNYFDADRRSFGEIVERGPFAGHIHVGDDVAWDKPHRTVVAVAPGRVKFVFQGNNWGGIVVVEHKDEKGNKICTLYSHLSPFIPVKKGQLLRRGQKLGSLGRSHTWANGGYRAHLHFGIHKGPYGNGRWVTGYVEKERYQDDQAGWRDPQKFINDHQ